MKSTGTSHRRVSEDRFRIAGLAGLLISLTALSPGLASVGSEGAAFLNIPVGAGPAALGSAYTALAHDAYAPVLNPGGLGLAETTELAGQHLSYLEGSRYEFASFVRPLTGDGAVGLGIQYFGSGDIAGTGINGQAAPDFSLHYAAYSAAYGHSLTEKLGVGLAAKLIEAKIDDVSAKAWAGDAGLMYRMSPTATLAATVANVGQKLTFIEDGDPLPMALRVGTAFQPHKVLRVSADGVYRRSGLGSFHMGIAWRPLELLSLRTGYRTDTVRGLGPLAGLSAGLGLHAWGQELAYAWVPYGDLGNTQYFSLVMRFGEDPDPKRNLIRYHKIQKHQSAGTRARDLEPEYEQLMQLLADDQAVRTAQSQPNEER